ncbi:MAG: hypothetical protein L3K15_01480 [Thermoplasmata archaeon]|nr:hypothetical protein [Thermoplasmata archaeon]
MDCTGDGAGSAQDDRRRKVHGETRQGQRVAFGTIASLGAVALVLLVAPAALGSPAVHRASIIAPYHGYPYVATTVNMNGCGATASNWKPPAFSLATGVAVLGEKSHAIACGSPASASVGTAIGIAGLFGKGFTTTSGVHHLVAHWKVVWGGKLVAVPGKGAVLAETYLAAFAALYDGTTGVYHYSTHNWTAINATTNGTVSFNSTKAVSIYVNATLVAGHTYYVITYVEGATSALATGTATGGSADAYLNKATFGNAGTLTSFTIS